MGSFMEYRVPTGNSFNGYCITNGVLADVEGFEFGNPFYPTIVIKSHSGKIRPRYHTENNQCDEVMQKIWGNALQGKPTDNFVLMRIDVGETSAEFRFADAKGTTEDGIDVTIHATEGLEIWLETQRDNGLPPSKYCLDSVCDDGGKYCMRITEFYEHIARIIQVINEPNPYYDERIHKPSLKTDQFLFIAECRN